MARTRSRAHLCFPGLSRISGGLQAGVSSFVTGWRYLRECRRAVMELSEETKARLRATVEGIFRNGKGILAADERGSSLEQRFSSFHIQNSKENRAIFRQILFSTDGMERYISGVILNEETVFQEDGRGRPLYASLLEKGILLGLKVDKGTVEMATGESLSVGNEDLTERMRRFADVPIRFAKWRAFYKISEEKPTDQAIEENSRELSTYAYSMQALSIVPIVEPEIIFEDGYGIQEIERTFERTIKRVYECMASDSVYLPGIIMKISFLTPGKNRVSEVTAGDIGRNMSRMLRHCISEETGGVVFLSGGHPHDQVVEYLQAVHQTAHFPFPVSFSFARALTNPVLGTWLGDEKNVESAKAAFLELARECADANLSGSNDGKCEACQK